MSITRKQLQIYVDVDNAKLKNGDNTVVTSPVIMYRKSQLLVLCDLRYADGSTYVALPTDASWLFAIDNSFDPSHEDPVVSTTAQFNLPGDRSDLDVAGGKISFRVDTSSLQLQTALGSDASKSMYGELWMLPVGGDPSLLIQFQITMANIVTDVGGNSNLIYTPTNILRFDGNDVVLLFADGTVAQRWVKP